MNALSLAVIHHAIGADLLFGVLVTILMAGLAYWVATLLLPPPWPTIAAILVLLIVLLYWLG